MSELFVSADSQSQAVSQETAGGSKRWAAAQRALLRILPLPLLVLAEPIPVDGCLWFGVGLYVGLIAFTRSSPAVKLLDICAALAMGSLALVTIGP